MITNAIPVSRALKSVQTASNMPPNLCVHLAQAIQVRAGIARLSLKRERVASRWRGAASARAKSSATGLQTALCYTRKLDQPAAPGNVPSRRHPHRFDNLPQRRRSLGKFASWAIPGSRLPKRRYEIRRSMAPVILKRLRTRKSGSPPIARAPVAAVSQIHISDHPNQIQDRSVSCALFPR